MTTAEMISASKIMKKENFVSIRDLQKSPTKSLSGNGEIKFVMNNGKPMGVYMDYDIWEDFLEDMEALSSDSYLKMIEESRKSKIYSREEALKMLNLDI